MQLDFLSPSHPQHFPFGELRGRHSGKKISLTKGKIEFLPVENNGQRQIYCSCFKFWFPACLFVSIVLFLFNSDFPLKSVFFYLPFLMPVLSLLLFYLVFGLQLMSVSFSMFPSPCSFTSSAAFPNPPLSLSFSDPRHTLFPPNSNRLYWTFCLTNFISLN